MLDDRSYKNNTSRNRIKPIVPMAEGFRDRGRVKAPYAFELKV